MLTQEIINEIAGLLAVEDQTIWDVGDAINQYELGPDDVAALSEQVDRSVNLLWDRARLAKMFPADMWDRNAAPIGVFEQLSRLDKSGDRRRMLKKREAWTVNALRKEIDEMLADEGPRIPSPRSTRMTRFAVDGMVVAMRSTLSPTGVLSINLPAKLAPGTKVKTKVNDDGTIDLNISLDVDALLDEDEPRHLKVVD